MPGMFVIKEVSMDGKNVNIVEVKDLNVVFNVGKNDVLKAVDGVTFSIKEGETLAVVGESGCGKTTLGKTILNIIKPASGCVSYRGKDLSKVSKQDMQRLRQKMQLIFQDPYESLDPRQNVYKTLLEPLTIHRKDLSKSRKKELIYKYLEAVNLRPVHSVVERYPHHLSGGQRQRLSIASTMILEPDFVVADEPVSMLDVSVRADILKLMLDIQGDKKLTYLFITHDLSLAWSIADRIAVFHLGRMVEIGMADDIVHNCVHPYTKALVSVIPAMAGSKKSEKRYILRGETPSPISVPPGCSFHTRCWLYQEKGCPAVCREKQPIMETVSAEHRFACHFK